MSKVKARHSPKANFHHPKPDICGAALRDRYLLRPFAVSKGVQDQHPCSDFAVAETVVLADPSGKARVTHRRFHN